MAVGNELTVVPKVDVRETEIGFASSSIMYEAMSTIVVVPYGAETVGITEVNLGAVFVT
jgi:hypothetical protein